MAPRAFWTGHLRLSLVNIPVRLYPATTSERAIAFHQIHQPSGKRIRYQKVAPGVGPVENEEITKGYEYEKGKYVLIDQKEIDEVKVDKEALDLAKELIKRKTGKFEPEQFKDEYSEAVWELINAKLEDRAPEIVSELPGTAKVINIMDALKKSVQQGKGAASGKTAAKRGASARSGNGKKAAKGAPKRKSA